MRRKERLAREHLAREDRLWREAGETALTLVEERGLVNARTWAVHCQVRDTGSFWWRVVGTIDQIAKR